MVWFRSQIKCSMYSSLCPGHITVDIHTCFWDVAWVCLCKGNISAHMECIILFGLPPALIICTWSLGTERLSEVYSQEISGCGLELLGIAQPEVSDIR